MDYNELKHHGVKGMRWGVRRRSVGGSSGGQRGGQPRPQQAPQRPRPGPRPASRPGQGYGRRPTDQELRNAINRIKLEREYAQLTAKQKSKGRKFVEDVLFGAAKQTATNYTARFMGKGIDKLFGLDKPKDEKAN